MSQSAASFHSSCPEVFGSIPRLIITRLGASSFKTPTDDGGKKSVLIRSSSFVGALLTKVVLYPMPVMPDCQAIVCLLPSS